MKIMLESSMAQNTVFAIAAAHASSRARATAPFAACDRRILFTGDVLIGLLMAVAAAITRRRVSSIARPPAMACLFPSKSRLRRTGAAGDN